MIETSCILNNFFKEISLNDASIYYNSSEAIEIAYHIEVIKLVFNFLIKALYKKSEKVLKKKF